MVKESENNDALFSEPIRAGLFRESDVAYLQGVGLDISPRNTAKIAQAVRGKFSISREESRNARHSLRARVRKLGVTDDYLTLMLAYNRACDLGLIGPKHVSGPREPFDKVELKVLALSAMAFVRGVIAQKLGIGGEEVDNCKASIVGKFDTETLFPVVAKVRRDMALQLQRAV